MFHEISSLIQTGNIAINSENDTLLNNRICMKLYLVKAMIPEWEHIYMSLTPLLIFNQRFQIMRTYLKFK